MNASQIHERLEVVDSLHRAAAYLARQFSLEMDQKSAQANVDARVILTNCQNYLMDDAYELSGLTEAGDTVQLRIVRRIKRPVRSVTEKGKS